jgi:ribosomal-protein-alanine N-acetyltransferase
MIAYQREIPRVYYELAVILRANSQLIGNGGIHISSFTNRQGWIDCFLSRKFWNLDYATEITIALLGFGFKDLKLHRIFANCAPSNIGSERVLIKVGLKREGYLRDYNLVRGKWQDALLYSMLEEEWIKIPPILK